MTFSKDDIEYHRLGYGYATVPAVNVKVDTYITDAMVKDVAQSDFAYDVDRVVEWWRENVEDDDSLLSDAFSNACEQGWEDLQDAAREIWNDPRLRVFSEGRSGGWAYVDSIRADDVEGWDAIELGKWSRFAKTARTIADDIPHGMVWSILANVYPEPCANDGASISA